MDIVAQLLEKLNELRPLIEEKAAERDADDCIAPDVIQALEASGVFNLMAPRSLGGLEAEPRNISEVLRFLSYCDGSTGWYCQAATTGVSVAGAFLGEKAIEAIFRSGAKATCAGQAAPTGKAERVGAELRLSGSYSFGSGLPNAQWIVGGYLLQEKGSLALNAAGQPTMLIALVPREKVEIKGNWDVLGLRGTGSYDFHVPEQTVHADFTFDAGNPIPQRGGALYRMGFIAIPALCHASFSMGITARLLDEWVAYARQKKRPAGGVLADMETFQRDLAKAHADYEAACSWVRAVFAGAYAAAANGAVTAGQETDIRLCASHMIATSVAISHLVQASAATTALRNGHLLQRLIRDIQASNAHFLTGEQSFIDAGRWLAGSPKKRL